MRHDTGQYLEFGRSIEFRALQSPVVDRQSFAGNAITRSESILLLGALANRHQERTILHSDRALKAENIPQVSVVALVEATG